MGAFCFGADDEARTRYLHLGKVALYQMSYIRICGDPDENRTRVTAVKGRCLNRLTTGPSYGSGSGIRTYDQSGMNRVL